MTDMIDWLRKNKQVKEMIRTLVPGFIIHLLRFTIEQKYRSNHSFLRVPKLYVNRIAPSVAVYLSWILWPAYIVMKKSRLKFLINNISDSLGHVVCELDWFFRRIEAEELPRDQRYAVVWPRSEVSRYAAKVYRDRFYAFIASDLIYCMLLPLVMRYTDITVDCGISIFNLKLQEHQNIKESIIAGRNRLIPRLSPRPYADVWDRIAVYYNLRVRTHGFYPMKPISAMSADLLDFLGDAAEKYAVVQIKTFAVNATAVATDPSTYLEAIDFLKNKEYDIVFAGREEMPEAFQSLGILNYAEWDKANFRYDLELIAGSGFVLSSGSGFTMLADTMDIPLVASNSWHLAVLQPGRFCVTVPTLLHGENGKLMRFRDQIDLFYTRGESNSPPPKSMKPRVATSDEILEGVKEALSLKECFRNPSNLQNQFKALRSGSPLFVAESRISQHFIERFKDLL